MCRARSSMRRERATEKVLPSVPSAVVDETPRERNGKGVRQRQRARAERARYARERDREGDAKRAECAVVGRRRRATLVTFGRNGGTFVVMRR